MIRNMRTNSKLRSRDAFLRSVGASLTSMDVSLTSMDAFKISPDASSTTEFTLFLSTPNKKLAAIVISCVVPPKCFGRSGSNLGRLFSIECFPRRFCTTSQVFGVHVSVKVNYCSLFWLFVKNPPSACGDCCRDKRQDEKHFTSRRHRSSQRFTANNNDESQYYFNDFNN